MKNLSSPKYKVISSGAKYNKGTTKAMRKSIFDDSEDSKSIYNNIIEIADEIEKSFVADKPESVKKSKR